MIKLSILIYMFTSPSIDYTFDHQIMFYSIWMLILQMFYFVFEFFASWIESDRIKRLRYYLVNLIFTPSILVTTLFVFVPLFDWTPKYSVNVAMVISNAGMHGLNIINLIVFVMYLYPNHVGKLKNVYGITVMVKRWREVAPYLLALCIPGVYLIAANFYSSLNDQLIYPTNILSFQKIDGKQSYAIETLLIMTYLIVVIQATFTYISTESF